MIFFPWVLLKLTAIEDFLYDGPCESKRCDTYHHLYIPSYHLSQKSDKKENQSKNITEDTNWKYLPTNIFSMVALSKKFKIFPLNNGLLSAGLLNKVNYKALFIIIIIF